MKGLKVETLLRQELLVQVTILSGRFQTYIPALNSVPGFKDLYIHLLELCCALLGPMAVWLHTAMQPNTRQIDFNELGSILDHCVRLTKHTDVYWANQVHSHATDAALLCANYQKGKLPVALMMNEDF